MALLPVFLPFAGDLLTDRLFFSSFLDGVLPLALAGDLLAFCPFEAEPVLFLETDLDLEPVLVSSAAGLPLLAGL